MKKKDIIKKVIPESTEIAEEIPLQTALVEPMMSSFFAYNGQTKSVVFNYNGSAYNCKSRAQFKLHTFARMVSGLNHFLVYWFSKDLETYNKICSMFFCGLMKVYNASRDMSSKTISNAERIQYIRDYSVVSEELCYYIVEYVDNVSDDTIEESAATTDITLTNKDARILAAISVVVKFNYLYSGLLRGNTTYDKTVEYCIDSLLYNLIKSVDKYYKTNENKSDQVNNNEDLHSIIDNFIYSLIQKIFNDKAKSSYKSKFAEFGKDQVKLASHRRVTIIASLRSYFAKLRNLDVAATYNLDPTNMDDAKSKLDNMYYTHGSTRWQDFSFNAKNMAAYMNGSLESIIKSQDLSLSLPDVNLNDFLSDSNDEKSNKRDAAFFDDKDKHLYHLRKDTMEYIMTDFVNELEKLNNPEFLHMMKYFKLSKKHHFNTFIEYKILLCLTGEAKIYYRCIGVFGKIILALFYHRIKSNPSLVMFHEMIDVMLKDSTDISSIQEDYLYSILESNQLYDPKYKKCKNIFVIYSINNTLQTIDPNIFAQFLHFIEDPSTLKKLLFPGEASIPDNLLKYDNKYDYRMNDSKPEVKKLAIEYMRNKRGC